MKIDQVPNSAPDSEFLAAWIADVTEAMASMTAPREQIVRTRLQRQLYFLGSVTVIRAMMKVMADELDSLNGQTLYDADVKVALECIGWKRS